MKTRTLKLGNVVEVTWIDAFCSGGWHEGPKDRKNWSVIPYTVKTIGYYMGKDKNYISVIQSEASDRSEDKVDNAMFIPHGMVKKIRKLK